MNSPYCLSSYCYDLPEDLIAQNPSTERGQSRLLVLDRRKAELVHSSFQNLLNYLPENCLLVANNSGVVPARLFGQRPNGSTVEMLILTPPPLLEKNREPVQQDLSELWFKAQAQVLLKPGKSIKLGDELAFGTDLAARVLDKQAFGKHDVELCWHGNLQTCLEMYGTIPLPPYIKRLANMRDNDRYQTVYHDRNKLGSVAAPTAGLHFSQTMRDELEEKGIEWATLTLHVGYGTFSPVRVEDIRKHEMHAEYVEIPLATAEALARAKLDGRKIIAVGTTSVRSLEGAAQSGQGKIPEQGWQGWTKVFLFPGHEFKYVDGMLTNFHLPKSSLLMLVAALAGYEKIMATYREAVRENYRFFSYGDAMLII